MTLSLSGISTVDVILRNGTLIYRQYAGYDYSQQGRFVPPDMMQPQQPYTGQIFQPAQAYTPTTPQPFYGNNFEDEPPLLEGRIRCRVLCSVQLVSENKSVWRSYPFL